MCVCVCVCVTMQPLSMNRKRMTVIKNIIIMNGMTMIMVSVVRREDNEWMPEEL